MRAPRNGSASELQGERTANSAMTAVIASTPLLHTEEAEPLASPDPACQRGMEAPACAEPLLALQTLRGRRGWERFDFYGLGLAAIDGVVDKMGFDTVTSLEALEAILLAETRRFAPDL